MIEIDTTPVVEGQPLTAHQLANEINMYRAAIGCIVWAMQPYVQNISSGRPCYLQRTFEEQVQFFEGLKKLAADSEAKARALNDSHPEDRRYASIDQVFAYAHEEMDACEQKLKEYTERRNAARKR